jgi:uncharacterized GH25 family protein
MQESKLSLMIQGHEIWLEKKGAENGNVELSLIYGHNMRQDGAGDVKRLSPLVYLPDGSKLEVALTPGEDRHILRFDTSKDGFYTAFVDMGTTVWSQTKEGYNEGPKFKFKDVIYAGAYHQMAKTVVAAGNAGEYNGVPLHGILEIVPKEPFGRAGEVMEMKVLYEDKPLVAAEVKAVSKKEGKEMAVVKTDENGVARVPVSGDGQWMFLVRHLDPTKKVNEEFDESVFVNTLVLEVR